MEPLSIEIRNSQTDEVIYEADVVEPMADGSTMTLSWDEKGNARLDLGQAVRGPA